MGSNFFDLTENEQFELIKLCSEKINLPEIIIEKDFWICWLLEKLFALPIQMAFKGGTSLSKVFNLINRFSEDCDITIDYHNFEPNLAVNQLTKSQAKKMSDLLKSHLKNYVSTVVLPYIKNQIKTLPYSDQFETTLSQDGEQLRFYYPSKTTHSKMYLRDHVLIEFGVRNDIEPCQKYRVEPYLSKINNIHLNLPAPMVNTLSPKRTFWEKATLIHVECHRNREMNSPERLSRHWYDLFMLDNAGVSEKALSEIEILAHVIENKKTFFNASYSHYDDCLIGKFQLIPADLKFLEKDYSKMIEAGMIQGITPKFSEIISSLSNLEIKIQNATLFLGDK